MRIVVYISVMLGLTGCFGEIGEKVTVIYDVPSPSIWAIPGGTAVDIGGEFVEIVGTDQCNNGFGDTYPCWKFSLSPGDAQLVTLSNGLQEMWTTSDAGQNRVYLVRPNGFRVISE